MTDEGQRQFKEQALKERCCRYVTKAVNMVEFLVKND